MSVSYKSPLQALIESADQYSRKQMFERGRDACVEYARKAYANRGDAILLLLADDLAEIEAPPIIAGRSGDQHKAGLEQLAQLRAHPGFASITRFLEKDTRSWRANAKAYPGAGGVEEHTEAMELLVKLLRNEGSGT